MKVKVSVKKGKSGTKIAEARLRATPVRTEQAKRLRPIYRTRAQLMIRLDVNGTPRAR